MESIPSNQAKLEIRVVEIEQNGKGAENISHENKIEFIPLFISVIAFSLQFFSMIY